MTNSVVLLKKNILEYIVRFNKEGLSLGANDLISARIDENSILATPLKVNLNEINEESFVTINLSDSIDDGYSVIRDIYKAREDIDALIHAHQNYSMIVSKAGVKVPPILDDMAQILGPNIYTSKDKSSNAILKVMKGKNACFIKNDGTITAGRTVDEAHTGCLVLEKASKVFVEAKAIGGAVSINPLEARLMHIVYKKKYSKKDQDAKIADLKESK